MVECFQLGQAALDVLVPKIPCAANVVVLTIRKGQLDILGQEVTNRAAKQVAFIVGIFTSGVCKVAIGEAFHLDSALALSQHAHRGSSY
ncbi:hypothetical protein D9M68_709950 [compost metagenome]